MHIRSRFVRASQHFRRRIHRLKAVFSFVFAVLVAMTAQDARAASTSDGNPTWEKSGDVLQWGIPLFGLGMSFLLDGNEAGGGEGGRFFLGADDASGLNWPGPRLGHSMQRDFLVSFVRMEVATYGLKYSLNTSRPNGGSQGFPSGHTAAAFMGAEFIRKNYGGWWGVPAIAAASWVGYTRVDSNNHYWRDVIGGALVGIGSNYDFDPIDTPVGQLSVGPTTFMPDLGGIPGYGDPLAESPFERPPPMLGLRFELRF